MKAEKPGFGRWNSLVTFDKLTEEKIDTQAVRLLSEMSLEEKIHQMSGDIPLIPGLIELGFAYNSRAYPAGSRSPSGIPGIYSSDGPRGIVIGHSTCFPVPIARGASWDLDLEEWIGDAIGLEARSQGINLFTGVCINILRHPAWGRAQETYGEDTYLLGEMGSALIRGVQRHLMACVKHYAGNSMENARFGVDVHMSERTLREVYLPHFKRCVDQGVASVMAAYNKVNGQYCGHNIHLVRDILKTEWGFKGFVVSDFLWGIRDAKEAIKAGLDLEMPLVMHYRKHLKTLVEDGIVPVETIDESVHRILRQKVRFARVGEPERYSPHAIANSGHRALARLAAHKSIVLLKNEATHENERAILPLDKENLNRLVVIGKLAAVPNTGDKGSSKVEPPEVVTPLQGIRVASGKKVELGFYNGRNRQSAVEAARQAEVVILVVGYTYRDEGENMRWRGGDREYLTLSPHDETLIKAVAEVNPQCIVVIMGGSSIITESWRDKVPGLIMAWYPGMEGGHAIADVLFGKINPSGKLPCTFPKSTLQLPFFDKNVKTIEYDLYHGYRLMDKQGYEPAFPFGFGLSYTTFRYSDLYLSRKQIGVRESLLIGVSVTNTGDKSGEEIVQLYLGYDGSKVDRPVKELKGFSRLKLDPGETKSAIFEISADQLAYFDEKQSHFLIEPITYSVFVGPSSRESDLLHGQFSIKT
jgi:beta-glucosidase